MYSVADSDLPPDRKMVKGRTYLIRKDPFFGGIAVGMRLKPITALQAAKLKTKYMAVDGKFIYYYPKGIAELDFRHLTTILAHEACHVALKHNLRRGERKFLLWNIACDVVVNNILKQAGYEFPDSGYYFRPDLVNMSVEQVYRNLKQESQENETDRDSLTGMMLATGPGAPGEQHDEGEDNDSEGQPSDVERSGSKKDQQTPSKPQIQMGSFSVDPDDLKSDDTVDNLPEIPDYENQFPELDYGIVLDAPEELMTPEAERGMDLSIEAAFASAKRAGIMPGALEDMVSSQREHKIDYKDLLREWLDTALNKGDYSWRRPNRRYLQHDMILPGLVDEEDTPLIALFCDSSGSVSKQEGRVYAREISGILSEFNCELKVMIGDTSIRKTIEYTPEDLPIDLPLTGRGGTKFKPVFDRLSQENTDAQALLFFTDMGAWDWDKIYDIGIPVLWMSTSQWYDDERVPFGTVINLEINEDD